MSKQAKIFVLVGLAAVAAVALALWAVGVVTPSVALVPVLGFSVGATVLVPGLRRGNP